MILRIYFVSALHVIKDYIVAKWVTCHNFMIKTTEFDCKDVVLI